MGGASTATVSLTLPDALGDRHLLPLRQGRRAGELTEVNETNNHRAAAISIGPDLLVTSFTAPAAAAAGSTITVSDTTANQGSAPVPASITSFYLSTNVVFDAGDILLHSRHVGPLAAGGASTASDDADASGNARDGHVLPDCPGRRRRRHRRAQRDEQRPGRRQSGSARISSCRRSARRLRAAAGGTIAVTEATANSGSGAGGARRPRPSISRRTSRWKPGDVRLVRVDPCRPLPLASPARRRRR